MAGADDNLHDLAASDVVGGAEGVVAIAADDAQVEEGLDVSIKGGPLWHIGEVWAARCVFGEVKGEHTHLGEAGLLWCRCRGGSMERPFRSRSYSR